MKIKKKNDHVIECRSDKDFPAELNYNGEEYIYGTMNEKTAVYFSKKWFYSD